MHRAGKYAYRLRPGTLALLRWCSTIADLAICSSTTPGNAKNVVNLLQGQTGIELMAIGYRDSTQSDPDHSLVEHVPESDRPIQSYDTIKTITSFLKQNPELTYDPNRCLLLDDSPIKVRFNPAANVILVPPLTEPALKSQSPTQMVECDCWSIVASEIQTRLHSM